MPKGFYRDPTLKFDVAKMQSALAEVDSRVARQSPLGERDINAICLTQIPNDPNSIQFPVCFDKKFLQICCVF